MILINKQMKRTSALLALIFLCLILLYIPPKETDAANTNKYLVLIQQKDGSWRKHTGLVEISENGDLMVKANKLSSVLGFTYKSNTDGTFVIKRSSTRYNTYTKKDTRYTYINKEKVTLLKASNKAYNSTISDSNLCQYSTLGSLLHYKYFRGSETKSYKSYSGVIYYSKYEAVPDTAPKAKAAPKKEPTPTPVPEPDTLNIEGVEFAVRDSFLTLKDRDSDWGGRAAVWRALEQELDSKIILSTDLKVGIDTIEFTHQASGSDGVYLAKTSSGYKISISVKLSGSVLADQNASVLKAMITTISSKPTKVYNAIYDSFTSDNDHGINKDKYKTIGDSKIKVAIKDGTVIYYINKA